MITNLEFPDLLKPVISIVQTTKFHVTHIFGHAQRIIVGANSPVRWKRRPGVVFNLRNDHQHEIVPGLWLGDIEAAKSAVLLDNGRVRQVINATFQVPCYHKWDSRMTYIRMAWFDDDRQVVTSNEYRQTYDMIDAARANDISLLVHCFAGRSRSASIVLYYLCRKERLEVADGMVQLWSRRSVSINERFVQCVAETLAEDFPDDARFTTYLPRLTQEFELRK